MSSGAYLRRLVPAPFGTREPLTYIPFVCAGAGYGSVILDAPGGASFIFRSSTGYVTIRAQDTGILTTAVADGETTVKLTARAHCIWPSDASGNLSGTMQQVVMENAGITYVDMAGWTTMTRTWGGSDLLHVLDLSANTALDLISWPECPTLTDVILPPTHSLAEVYLMDCLLSEATVNNILVNLLANGFTGTCDLSHGSNAAPTGAGLVAKSSLITGGATVTTN